MVAGACDVNKPATCPSPRPRLIFKDRLQVAELPVGRRGAGGETNHGCDHRKAAGDAFPSQIKQDRFHNQKDGKKGQ